MITALQNGIVTVANQGTAGANEFSVRVTGASTVAVPFPALAAGASTVRQFAIQCQGSFTATADDAGVIAESDETDNSRSASC